MMSLAENFQRFSGSLKPRQEALALFLLRNAQMEFQHQRAVAGEMAFKGANILETMFPDVLFGHGRRQLLPFEEIGMHPHRQHFFVMRAVENADRHRKLWASSSVPGTLKAWTAQPCGLMPAIT